MIDWEGATRAPGDGREGTFEIGEVNEEEDEMASFGEEIGECEDAEGE